MDTNYRPIPVEEKNRNEFNRALEGKTIYFEAHSNPMDSKKVVCKISVNTDLTKTGFDKVYVTENTSISKRLTSAFSENDIKTAITEDEFNKVFYSTLKTLINA